MRVRFKCYYLNVLPTVQRKWARVQTAVIALHSRPATKFIHSFSGSQGETAANPSSDWGEGGVPPPHPPTHSLTHTHSSPIHHRATHKYKQQITLTLTPMVNLESLIYPDVTRPQGGPRPTLWQQLNLPNLLPNNPFTSAAQTHTYIDNIQTPYRKTDTPLYGKAT